MDTTYPLPMAGPRSARAEDRVGARQLRDTLLFLVLHVPLGFAVTANSWIATAHAVATAAIGLLIVAEARTPNRVVPVLAYVVACESLWRVGEAKVFYESAKYLLTVLSLFTFVRFQQRLRGASMPVLYFVLLVPSIFVMPEFDRQDVSFNLSGPFSLAVTTFVLSRLELRAADLRKTLTSMLAPIVALAAVATFFTVTTEEIQFYTSKVASGGLGQNQASSLFGLGFLVTLLYLNLLRRHRLLSWIFGAAGIWCGAQAALTFSRGGLATAIGALAAGTFFLSLDRRFRGAAIWRVAMVAFVASLFIVPMLQTFTRGALSDRFTNTSLTGRDKIIQADLMAFRENPIFGLGPGQSYQYHSRTFRASSSHTEYSRLVSEHGMFGLIALCLLLMMGVQWWRQQPTLPGKALSAALVTWSLLYMFHQAMRMAVVSFLFALASMCFVESPTPPTPPSRRRSHVPRHAHRIQPGPSD